MSQLLRDTLRHRVREARKHAGLSLTDLGDLVGVDQRSVRRWEDGERLPGLLDLCRIASYCDVTLTFLLFDVEAQCERIAMEP